MAGGVVGEDQASLGGSGGLDGLDVAEQTRGGAIDVAADDRDPHAGAAAVDSRSDPFNADATRRHQPTLQHGGSVLFVLEVLEWIFPLKAT